MKRTLAIILALVLCVGVFATVGFAAENDTYELKTELKDGDKVVIYNASVKKAISNEAAGTYYKAGADVTVSDGKIVNPDVAIVWTVETVEGGIKLKNADGETLKCTGGRGNLNTLTDTNIDEVWEIKTATTANSVYIVNTTSKGSSGDSRYIEWYATANDFSCYFYYSNSEAVYAMELYVLKTAEPTPTPAEKVTVHAKVPAAWEKTNCYVWGDAGEVLGAWSGTAMTLNNGWYEIEVPNTTVNMIINNGSEQTIDLALEAGKEVWITLGEKNGAGKYEATVSYTNPNPAPSNPVEKPDDNKENSKTGDATALVAISAAMLLAATGVVAVVSNKKHF